MVPEVGGVLLGPVLDDRYEFVRRLGSGGMADVYLANDRLLGRQVAVKVLSSRFAQDEQFVERFRREASSAASLNHPNIVQIYDRGQAEDTYYIAMEYLEGRSLKEIIVEHAPLSPELLTSISVQILEALRVAHAHDVIHRDIKPQNIIINHDGQVKVTDFGIARAGSVSAMTEVGSIIGTAHYLSPEQAQGQPVEAASDLYSLGVVMYEMATGTLPFDGDNPLNIAMQHVHEQPVAPRSMVPELPENLEAVILHSLGKLPTERYLTAQAMLDDLGRVKASEPVTTPAVVAEVATRVMSPAAVAAAQPTEVRRRPSDETGPALESLGEEPRRRRNAWPWVLVAILILALAGGAYAIFTTWDNTGTDLGVVPGVVPGVVGLSEAEAKTKIEAAGFEFGKEGEESSAEVVEGDVTRQDPEQGTKVTEGKTVSVWMSSGASQVEAPNVVTVSTTTVLTTVKVPAVAGVGLTFAQAKAMLATYSLRATVTFLETPDYKQGLVIGQDPAAGAEVQQNSYVELVVSKKAKPNGQDSRTISDYDGDLVLSGDWTITGRVNGNVKISEGTLTVTGWVDGNIEQHGRGSVLVLRGAHVNGNIYERDDGDVVVSGYLDGNVEESGDGSVEITAGGEVEGNVFERDKGTVKNAGYVSGSIDY